MKTPSDWVNEIAEGCAGHPAACICDRCKHGNEAFLLESDITEIQRDAREGMVPVDDVAYCIHNLEVGGCSEEYERGYNACAYGARALLRAKHPNLFTT